MPREYSQYLEDILEAIARIEEYTGGMSFEEFAEERMTQDAVVRNLEIIGESVKNIPEEVKRERSDIEWRKIAGLRDILIHAYFGIDIEIVWDIVKSELPPLREKIEEMLFDR